MDEFRPHQTRYDLLDITLGNPAQVISNMMIAGRKRANLMFKPTANTIT